MTQFTDLDGEGKHSSHFVAERAAPAAWHACSDAASSLMVGVGISVHLTD